MTSSAPGYRQRTAAAGRAWLASAAMLAACAGCSGQSTVAEHGTGGSNAATGGVAEGGGHPGGKSDSVQETGGQPAGGSGGSNGGRSPVGGSGSGGVATGGVTGQGGTPTGGAHDSGGGGGAVTGGGRTGGGASTGGAATGGVSTGGAAAGGVSTGGAATGGTSTGGAATGGAATGGGSTGGDPNTPCDFGSLTTYEDNNASATYYDPEKEVNCSFPVDGSNVEHVYTGDGAFTVAMGPSEYGGSAICGACLEVTRDDGARVVVTATDQCPGCQPGHIDLSRAAFLEIGTITEGYLGTANGGAVGLLSWKYVPCPVQGNIIIALKEPTNDGWNEFMVENVRLPVAKLEAKWDTTWVTGTRQTYNYFNVGERLSFPLRIRVTSVAGDAVDGVIAGGQVEEELDGQFPACK
jgi:expansin